MDSSRDEKVWELPGEWYAFAKRGELVSTHFLDFLGSFTICWIFFNCEDLGVGFSSIIFFWHFHLYQDQHQGRFDFHFLTTIVHKNRNGVKWNHTSTRFRFLFSPPPKSWCFPRKQLVWFLAELNSRLEILSSCNKTTTHVYKVGPGHRTQKMELRGPTNGVMNGVYFPPMSGVILPLLITGKWGPLWKN